MILYIDFLVTTVNHVDSPEVTNRKQLHFLKEKIGGFRKAEPVQTKCSYMYTMLSLTTQVSQISDLNAQHALSKLMLHLGIHCCLTFHRSYVLAKCCEPNFI